MIVVPGEEITRDTGLLRGHGTYANSDGVGTLISSTAGVVERVQKLVTVRAVKGRYHGEVWTN
jgi:exosome complex component RRP4